MTYSIDFRQPALSIQAQEHRSFETIAERFGVGKARVCRWSKQIKPQRTRHKPATTIDMEALKRDVEESPEAYH